MRTIYLGLFFLCYISNCIAQTAEDVFIKYIDAKKSELEYQVNVNYEMFKGISGSKVYESYSGIQARYEMSMYQKIGDMELVQSPSFKVKLNKSEKAMIVSSTSSKNFSQDFEQIGSEYLLKFFEDKLLEDEEDNWRLILKSKSQFLNQFSKIELLINKSNFQIEKQIIYYASLSDFSAYDPEVNEPEIDIPRLEVTYKKRKKTVSLDKSVFEKSKYFTEKNEKITASSAYQGFEILHSK